VAAPPVIDLPFPGSPVRPVSPDASVPAGRHGLASVPATSQVGLPATNAALGQPVYSFGFGRGATFGGNGLAIVLPPGALLEPASEPQGAGGNGHSLVAQLGTYLARGMSGGAERFDSPAANLPALFAALLMLGFFLRFAVTEASPRSWQTRPVFPPI
jgi:hypothetical protein